MLRLRRGSRTQALGRIKDLGPSGRDDVRGFVDAHHLPPVELAVCGGPISRVFIDLNRIEISEDLSSFDMAFAYAHELGHLFDVDYLHRAHRLKFSDAVGTGAAWSGENYNRNIEEAWANAFAVTVCSGPWWGDGWVCCNWPQQRTQGVLDVCSEVILEACGERPLAARVAVGQL